MHNKSFKILIADDNIDNIHLLKRRLHRDNYIFFTAMDGQETLDQVQQVSPDLVLLDVNMPIFDGFEVCHKLRANKATRSTPIIIITAAKTSIDDQIKGLGLGADDYITKPFNAKELVARVERKLQVKVLEDELYQQKKEMTTILSSAVDAIFRIDAKKQIQFCNPAAIHLFCKADINTTIGHHYHDAFSAYPNFIKTIAQTTSKTHTHTFGSEVEIDNKTLFMNISPITNTSQQQDGWVLMLRDISHLKKIDRLKSTIIANVAHDLKNPLSSATLYMEMLVDDISNKDSQQYTMATNALKSIERMKDMTIHLLDLERLEAGEALDMRPCNLAEITQDLAHQMNSIAQKQNIQLTIKFPDTPIIVNGDIIYLSRAISNLMSNALKFTPDNGKVSIKVEQQKHNAIISIQDTGPGISLEHQTHIFDRFYRVKDQKEVKNLLGTGLGLPITKSIVLQHQGLIWLKSQVGKGSTFYISLPCISKQNTKNTPF